MNTRLLRTIGYALFSLGVLFGFALAVVLIWSRLEAVHYFFQGATYDPFRRLNCPALIAPTEKGIVTAVFDNPTNREQNFFSRAEISGKPSTRRVDNQIAVPPHQRKSIQLTVDSGDRDLMYFIFVRMMIAPTAISRSQEAVCGIMVVDILGLTGAQISLAAFSLSFLGMGFGLSVLQKTGPGANQNITRIMQAIGFVLLVTLLAASLGWWIAGIALSAITAMLLVISLRFALV
jgi:hypothetical protein